LLFLEFSLEVFYLSLAVLGEEVNTFELVRRSTTTSIMSLFLSRHGIILNRINTKQFNIIFTDILFFQTSMKLIKFFMKCFIISHQFLNKLLGFFWLNLERLFLLFHFVEHFCRFIVCFFLLFVFCLYWLVILEKLLVLFCFGGELAEEGLVLALFI
jgi:hypothetical protein